MKVEQNSSQHYTLWPNASFCKPEWCMTPCLYLQCNPRHTPLVLHHCFVETLEGGLLRHFTSEWLLASLAWRKNAPVNPEERAAPMQGPIHQGLWQLRCISTYSLMSCPSRRWSPPVLWCRPVWLQGKDHIQDFITETSSTHIIKANAYVLFYIV